MRIVQMSSPAVLEVGRLGLGLGLGVMCTHQELHLARGSSAAPATDFVQSYLESGCDSAVAGTAWPPDPMYAGRPASQLTKLDSSSFVN